MSKDVNYKNLYKIRTHEHALESLRLDAARVIVDLVRNGLKGAPVSVKDLKRALKDFDQAEL